MNLVLKKLPLLSIFIIFIFSLLLPLRVHALSGSAFQAGRIIDDGIFFDSSSMDISQIQAFLNSKVPVCDTNGTQPYGGTTRAAYSTSRGYPPPFICLKDFRQDTPTMGSETGLCNTYGGGNKSAAQIIRDVAHDCGINPKVLIVLLEKEQALVTDDWPWSIQYKSATGYGCPDTAACDSNYYGFFNQVYNAARQFKKYARDSASFGYRANRDNFVQFNPNSACGGTTIYIQNQATAGLYNYTPYQPNTAALNNLDGSGDSCSAYGNRNFWKLYSTWFGPTIGHYCDTTPQNPVQYTFLYGKINRNIDSGNLFFLNGTQTQCIEAHGLNRDYNNWIYHASSNQPTIDPANSTVTFADINGDGIDEPILVGLRGTGSGKELLEAL